ncbi:hypothetical protein HMPREF9120_01738 [Neisseria sp. oral taxon 020 str. F0370]|nr:hypothetical protein HMPREF9120_01738 [Neisseria sp. oral taxon 020 str. F0370]
MFRIKVIYVIELIFNIDFRIVFKQFKTKKSIRIPKPVLKKH